MKKPKKKVKVVKIEPIDTTKTRVELEVEGEPPAEIPAEPLQVETLTEAQHPLVKWLKSLW